MDRNHSKSVTVNASSHAGGAENPCLAAGPWAKWRKSHSQARVYLRKLCDIGNAITHHLYFYLRCVTRPWKPASISQLFLCSQELLGIYVTHWQRQEATQHVLVHFVGFLSVQVGGESRMMLCTTIILCRFRTILVLN